MDCFRSKARTTKNMTTQLPRDQKLVHLTGQAWHEESCTWRHRKKMRQIHTGHERHGPSSSGRRRGDPYFKKEPSVHWHRDVPVQNHIIPSIFRTELTLSDTAGLSHLISPAPTPEPPPPPSAFNATVTVPKSQQSFPDAEAVPSQNAGLEVFPITAIHPQMKKGFRVVLRGNGSRPLIASSSVGVGKDQVLATSRILTTAMHAVAQTKKPRRPSVQQQLDRTANFGWASKYIGSMRSGSPKPSTATRPVSVAAAGTIAAGSGYLRHSVQEYAQSRCSSLYSDMSCIRIACQMRPTC